MKQKELINPSKHKQRFTHLHLHTSYSLLDGAIRIPDLMRRVRELGMDSVAITDHGNMFGAIEFYKAAVKQQIKPIIGCEFYISPGDRREKRNLEKLADGNNYHLILLAQNTKGYQNLIQLSSCSYSEGFYRKPRIDYELLANHSDGLVCLTACLGGEVHQKILRDRFGEASSLAGKLKEIFGKDRFYLEIQDHGLPEEEIVAKGNLEIARRNEIQLCLTNDSHFLNRSDQSAQDILLRINQKKTVTDPLGFGFNSEFYVKSPDEMSQLFPEITQAFHNTSKIADSIDLNFQFGNPLLPKFQTPEGETLDEYLHKLVMEGLKNRYKEITPEIQNRFDYEYETITRMDFSGYFLIVQDFIQFARSREIPVGPGRGSAAGSIISYALGITDIEPLRYGLLFERFLNPSRREMPDIDVDFCTERREEVIQYVRSKYGTDKVGQIITYGTMTAKACLKDVARVMKIPFEQANHISKMFPEVLNISIQDAVQSSQELKEYSESGEEQKKLFQVAGTLEGNVRHTGIHAAGIVIAPEPLDKILPMASVSSRNGTGERIAVSQYDMQSLSEVGLVKMDLLGLRNLTVIDSCLRGIKERLGHDVHLDSSKMNDPKAYQLIQSGNVAGVFQLESSPGMREFVIRMKPECFDDIIALIALFRPGPLQSGMADSYINRKKKREKVHYEHIELKPILEETYGVILYQEQVMKISQVIGNFTPSEADGLRKAMGKKIKEKMNEMKIQFIQGAIQQGYENQFADDLYEQMAQFAGYGFNKSHSAAYSCIVYQTAYLKANYPTDYMCALLNSEMEKTEKLLPGILASKAMGIEILGPDLNQSQVDFSVEEKGKIRFGLAGVKNVGVSWAKSHVNTREKMPNQEFDSFIHFIENTDFSQCNRRMIESLNYAGAFISLNHARKSIHEIIEGSILHGQKIQKDRSVGQFSLFDTPGIEKKMSSLSPTSNILLGSIPTIQEGKEYDESEILRMEKEVIGFYLSGHPMSKYQRILKLIQIPDTERLASLPPQKGIEIAGVISNLSIHLTRSGKEMCRMTIDDLSGSCNALVFPRTYEKIRKQIQEGVPFLFSVDLEKKEDTGTPFLIIQSLQELHQELLNDRQEKSLHIKLLYQKTEHSHLAEQLKTILLGRKGTLKVYFHLIEKDSNGISKSRQIIQAHESFRVQYSTELYKRLEALHQVYGIYLSIGTQITCCYERSQEK